MAKLSHGMTDRNLSEIFEWIEHNELALPELQRPSVWGSNKIPRLLSSVYSDYPFGIFLIWTPKKNERIHCKPFMFQKSTNYNTQEIFTHYLIDGQQRLTSFFRALHDNGDLSVAFNIQTEEFALPDAKIRAMLKNPAEYHWYKLRELLKLDTIEIAELFKVHSGLGKNHLEGIFGNQGKLQKLLPTNISISFYNINEKSYGDVSEIFERINLGTPVKRSQIVLGKLSTVYPGVVSEVEIFLEQMRLKNGCRFDLDLFISTFSTTATMFADVNNLEKRYLQYAKPNIEKVKSDIRKTKKVLKEALDFIEEHLFIDTMKYCPSERTLTALSFLFAKKPTYIKDSINTHKIVLWVAWALLTGHHNDHRRLVKDIAIIRDNSEDIPELLTDQMKKAGLRANLTQRKKSLLDMESPISRNNAIFGFVYALTRWKEAVSFISRDPIKTEAVDETEDEEEYIDENTVKKEAIHEHHIYPSSRLKEESVQGEDWITKEWINDIANLTFLTGKDNIALKDPEIDYLWVLPQYLKKGHMIANHHYRKGQYKKFLKDRRKLIKEYLELFLKELQSNAGYPWG